jgi:hypothetical protein
MDLADLVAISDTSSDSGSDDDEVSERRQRSK